MMRYDLLEPESDLNVSLDMLTSVFAPIYTEHWLQVEAPLRGNPTFSMNVNAFAQMWFSKVLRIFVAYGDDKKLAGYLLGMSFRPLTYQANIFQVEEWYARDNNQEVVKGLFEYTQSALRFIGADELWISHNESVMPPPLDFAWRRKGAIIIDRYGK